jgi:hypothetical protein
VVSFSCAWRRQCRHSTISVPTNLPNELIERGHRVYDPVVHQSKGIGSRRNILFEDPLPQVSKVRDEVVVRVKSKLRAVGQVVDGQVVLSLRGPFSRRFEGNPSTDEIL